MTANVVNRSPYLKDQRGFPKEPEMLALEVDRAWVELANGVNERSIGIYPTSKFAITGNKWYIGGQVNQTIRKVFSFTSTSNIAHGIDFDEVVGFVHGYGTFTDGTNWYGLFFGTSTAVAGEVEFYITPTNIVFVVGGGAPSLTQGYITLEWLSNI